MAFTFTCLACNVIFDDAEVQRSHYKTDWHRYNLKRKVAELPSITFNEFQNKVEYQKQKKEEKIKDHSSACKICNKSFSTNNAHENHLKSKKHKEMVVKTEKMEKSGGKERIRKSVKPKIRPKAGVLPPLEDDAIDDDNSDEWEDIDDGDDDDDDVEIIDEEDVESEALSQSFCFFCPHESVNAIDNFRHMTKSHSFFIPDLQFVIDIEAFFVYLGAKVGDGKICLFCNNHSKQFQTIDAVQKHMVDKGHCTLDYEGDAMLEYADFYDFSSSYPDAGDVEDTESEISTNEGSLTVDPDTMELILPSGVRAGHRALKRYYNQNAPLEHIQQKRRPMITWSNSQCQALGVNQRQLSVALRQKLVARKMEHKHRAQFSMRLGIKNNKMQKYFVEQNQYCG